MIEDHVRAFLNSRSAVTALVGSRIFPDFVPQSQSLPAITIDLLREEHQNDLDYKGGSAKAFFEIAGYSSLKAEARAVMEAVRVNGTNPGTGLAGHQGNVTVGAITLKITALLTTTETEYVSDDDGGDHGTWIVSGQYEIDYEETV